MPILANGGVIINNLFVHKGTKWYNYVRYAFNDINLEREFLYEKENIKLTCAYRRNGYDTQRMRRR